MSEMTYDTLNTLDTLNKSQVMDSIFIIPILNVLPFIDVIRFCSTNRRYHTIQESDEYWQQRANLDPTIFDAYLLSNITPPKARYAWALIKSGFILSDPSAAVYLSVNKDLLFPGLEYITGVKRFLRRAVIKQDLDLINYGIGFGPTSIEMFDIITKAVDISSTESSKQLAFYLSKKFSQMAPYKAKYEPESAAKKYSPCILAKYGHIKFTQEIAEISPGPLSLYFLGMIKGKRFDQAIELLGQMPKPQIDFVADDPIGGSWIGECGNIELIDKFIDRSGTKSEQIGRILSSAIAKDHVNTVRHILRKYQVSKGSLTCISKIKSEEMYDLVRTMNPNSHRLCIGEVLAGGNIRLFFKILPNLINQFIVIPMYQTSMEYPMIFKEILLKKFGMDINMKVMNDPFKDGNMSAYTYDGLRRLGYLRSNEIHVIPEHLNLDLLPFLKADLADG